MTKGIVFSPHLPEPAKEGHGSAFHDRMDRDTAPGFRPGMDSLVVFVATMLLGAVAVGYFDVPVARRASELPIPLREAAGYLTLLGLSGYMLVISAGLAMLGFFAARRGVAKETRATFVIIKDRAAFFFLVIAGSGIAAQIVKHLVGRARPKLMNELGAFHFDPFSIRASLASFPSGHTTSIFAAALTLSLMAPRWRVPLFLVAGLVALSRVAVGAHYVSDVVAGAGLGLVFVLGVAAVSAAKEWVFDRRGERLVLHRSGEVARVVSSGSRSAEPVA